MRTMRGMDHDLIDRLWGVLLEFPIGSLQHLKLSPYPHLPRFPRRRREWLILEIPSRNSNEIRWHRYRLLASLEIA
jgi:hypothetical protein